MYTRYEMALPEMGIAFGNMSGDIHAKLSGYMTSLQHRYGDPRVYEMQREQIQAERAAMQFAQVKSQEQALEAAYAKSRQTVREQHASKRAQRTPSTNPESAPRPQTSRKPKQPPPRSAAARAPAA